MTSNFSRQYVYNILNKRGEGSLISFFVSKKSQKNERKVRLFYLLHLCFHREKEREREEGEREGDQMGVVGGPQSKGNGSRGRPYALMLLLAFGAALLGVMVLHKFRERRICNLLLKQRDQELLSLQLLFQKQIDRNRELEKNNEDMKATVYSLRTQKMELDRRLVEMQSAIDSLRDEQKTIDVAFQEKKNEIKMLREREIESGKENPQVAALTESLTQKEAELEDLKRQLESHVNVRSVATDDPSNPHVYSTMSGERNEQLLESMDNNRRERTSADFREGRTSRRVEIGTQKSAKDTERREMMGEQRPKQEILGDEGKEPELADGDVRKVDGSKESGITKDHRAKEVKDSQEVTNQKPDGVLRSGMKKMETETGKYDHTSKIKGKRWRYIARKRRLDNGWRLISKNGKLKNNRNLDDSGVRSLRNRKFFEGGGASNEEKMIGEYLMEAIKSVDSSDTNLLNYQPKKIVEDYRGYQMVKEGKMLMKPKASNSTASDIEEQKQDDRQLGHREVRDGSIEQNPGEQVEPKDFENEEKQEPERDAEGRINGESSSDVEDREEYKEETDELEF